MQTFVSLDGLATDKTRAIREIITLTDGLKPGVDVFTEDFAASMVDIGAITPAPEVGWTTTDGGKTFAAPIAVVPPVPSLTSVQAALCSDIDTQAEAQRLRYVTPGACQMATYLLKRSQALQALAAQSANTAANMTADALATAYPYLAAEIGITADPTTKAAATDVYGVARAVSAVSSVWQPLDIAIEKVRLATKLVISAATTVAAAQAAHDVVAWPAPPAS